MAPLVAPQPDDPEEINLIRQYTPNGIKNLRACLRCRIIMTKDQFLQHGCPTCKDTLRMQDEEGRVAACTTMNFHGFITLLRPGAFVSRFNGLQKRRPGCYALTCQGTIPDYIMHESEFERESDIEGGLDRSSPARGSRGDDESEAEMGTARQATASPSLFAKASPSPVGGTKPNDDSAFEKELFSPDNADDKDLFSPVSDGEPVVDQKETDIFSPQTKGDADPVEVSPQTKKRKLEDGSAAGEVSPDIEDLFGEASPDLEATILAPEEDAEFKGAPA